MVSAAFEKAYSASFSRLLGAIPVRIVSLRTAAIGKRPPFDMSVFTPASDNSLKKAVRGTRPVWFGDGWRDAAIWSRRDLPAGAVIEAPAILEQPDATIVVEPGLARPCRSARQRHPREAVMKNTALLLVDLQNDFVHPDGAYGRAGQGNAAIAALPRKAKAAGDLVRSRGGVVIATLFTLVPGRGGEPIISPHLKTLRPFLGKGDFASGRVGPAACRRTRAGGFHGREDCLFGLLHDAARVDSAQDGDRALYVGGIVTNGGVASTVRDAHVREFEVTVLEDGCAAFSPSVHRAAIEGLRPVAAISSIAKAAEGYCVGMSAQGRRSNRLRGGASRAQAS